MTPEASAIQSNAIGWRCATCGVEVRIDHPCPWRCPNATAHDRHHVLELVRRPAPLRPSEDPNPFVAFGSELGWQAFALANGMTIEACAALVRQLDERVAGVAGTGFRVTPFARADTLSDALGFEPGGGVWIKDETRNVSGSHKARHLASILLQLKAAELLGVGPRDDRLVISSCGNAALAAATLAAADYREVEVFVPPWANPSVIEELLRLRAIVTECPRRVGDPPGDPCVHRFREAVAGGAVPFTVQGPENALCNDGGRTLGWEMVEDRGCTLDRVFVQVGGGALASSVGRACADAGVHPRFHAVQTEGCAPLARAWERALQIGLDEAPKQWSACMWPWEEEPRSAATGILDDETYDWLGVLQAMVAGGGSPIVVPERLVAEAYELGAATTGIDASPTGTAGLAGLLAVREEIDPGERVAVIFSGVER